MTGITTHVLDTARGKPAEGMRVRLERLAGGGPVLAGEQETDADGRARGLLGEVPLAAGRWRLTFGTGAWFAARGIVAFFPEVRIDFDVADPGAHHHVPLLLSPYGYSTYRGS